jgi:hypothetical protein
MVPTTQVTHYKESILSVVKVLEFIRRKLPYKLVQRIDDTTVDAFLEGWPDNRVRVLLFGKLDIVRYYLMCSKLVNFICFTKQNYSTVCIIDPSSKEVKKHLPVVP